LKNREADYLRPFLNRLFRDYAFRQHCQLWLADRHRISRNIDPRLTPQRVQFSLLMLTAV
jgi:hypothetical protein